MNSTSTPRPALPPGMFPPGYVPNYAKLASWDSSTTAFIFLSIAAVMTLFLIRNFIFFAKTKHTKLVYLTLLLWSVLRLISFAMRGHTLLDNNGQDLYLYKWSQIIVSIGFMPLAEVSLLNVIEGTQLIYNMSPKTRGRINFGVRLLFILFVASIVAFVIDFTWNKPFGTKVRDETLDLVFREIGFNGLFAITVYTGVGAFRNMVMSSRRENIADEFVFRLKYTMGVVFVQSVLMIIKLSYITYRNWKPEEFVDEKYWYILSIAPEILFVMFFCHPYLLSVFDDIETHPTKGQTNKAKTSLLSLA